MNATTYGWIVLALAAGGLAADRARLASVCPAAPPGWLGSAAIGISFLGAIGDALRARRPRRRSRARWWAPRSPTSTRPGMQADLAILVDPLVGADVPGGVGRLVPDPPLLGRLHDLRPGLRALLRLPQLLRVLDAAAGPGVQLRAADRGLGVRGRGVLPADLLLVPARHRHRGRHQGVRDQRDRRRGPGDRRVPAVRRHRRAGLRGRVQRRRRRPSGATTASSWPPA